MANPFDQFDAAPAATATVKATNPFDQFDAPAAPVREASWFDKVKSFVTGEKPDLTKKPSVGQDIIQSAPGAGARASAGLLGTVQAAIEKTPLNLLQRVVSEKINQATGQLAQPNVNLGATSLSGLKQLMGSTYQDPQTKPGEVADFALQTILFGAKQPKDLLNGMNTVKSLVSGVAGGTAGVLVPDDYPKVKAAAQMIGGFSPSLIEAALKSPDRATKNAAKMIQQAMKGKTEQEWQEADALFQKSKQVGVPLAGPEAFPGGSQVQQLASDVAASPAGGAQLRDFTRPRADQVQASVKQHLERVGKDIGGQEAANQVQGAADKVISNAQEDRTKITSPYYKFQRDSDVGALSLKDQIEKTQKNINAGTKWKNDAVQQAGRWYAFSHEMGLKANEVANKVLAWAEQDAKDFARLETDGGRPGKTGLTPKEQGLQAADPYLKRAEEGKSATYEAVKAARERQAYLDQWKRDVGQKSDLLASKNLPQIENKVNAFLTDLDREIRLVNPETTEGKILTAYRNEIAPGGKPLSLPSQLESVYKSNRDKLDLNLQPTAAEKTTAAVLKSHVKRLDSLIQDVSPAIRQGREIYAEMSRDLVDPLFKGPMGKLAGKGVDAQREAPYARMISEMQSDTATPKRIAEIADQFKKVDKEAFPNMTRAYLEERLNTSLKDLQGRRNPAAGANFRNAVEGTPKDKANLKTMIEKTAETQGQNPKQVYAGFRTLLDVLDATGRVPGMGSQTQSRMENAAMARQNPVSGAVEAVSTTPTHRIAKWMDDLVYKKTYSKLAEVFTSPESVKEMKKLAELKPTSPEAQQIVATMLTSLGQSANADDGKKNNVER